MAKNSIADAINAGLQGFMTGRQLKQQSQDKALAEAMTLAKINEMTRKSDALSAPAPTGYFRDPYSGQLKEDLTYTPDMSQFQTGDGKGPVVKEFDRFGRPKSYKPAGDLTPGQRTAKDKATQAIFDAVEANKIKREQIAGAETALPNVPQGILGASEIQFKKWFSPNDPMLEDWQKIKMIGTDAQLLNTARIKGAISDKEMALFAKAAANDDVISTPRLKPVLKKLKSFIDADESAKMGAYQKSYGEDPREWFGGLPQNPERMSSVSGTRLPPQKQQGIENVQFRSPDEADKSGLPSGTVVMVAGRKYQI